MYHCRKWLSEYHLSFSEIEKMPLEILLDIEIVDSKVEAAFEQQRNSKRGKSQKQVFIEQIL